MASTFKHINSKSDGAGVRVPLADDEGAIIKKGVLVRSTDDNAIEGGGYNHEVKVMGKVVGHLDGIRLGVNAMFDNDQKVTISADGKVSSGLGGVTIYGYDSEVVNHGTINGYTAAVYMSGDLSSGFSKLTNTGLMHSDTSGAVVRAGSQNFRLDNSGTMSSDAEFVYFGANSSGRQNLFNSGEMKGNVLTGTDDDHFTGQGGFVRGYVLMGDGDDVYKAGTGRATKVVDGDLGEDTLKGGKLKDILDGGENADTLTGGGGGDRFVFADRAHSSVANADLVTDFQHSQHDKIDLRTIDAMAGGGMNDAYDFVGKAAFSGDEGELRFRHEGGQTFVEGDWNGDMVADFMIELDGKINLKDADFLL